MTFSKVLAVIATTLMALQCAAACTESSAPCKWDVAIWTGLATGEENTNSFAETQILDAGVSIARVFWSAAGHAWYTGDLEYGFSFNPLFLQLRPQALHGIAFQPLILRWNSDHLLGHASPYIELAGGAVHTNLNLPAGDTSTFNFTAQGGAGVYLPVTSRRALDLGMRWSHISNANLGIQNPEFNGIELRIAYHWLR
jgi:hypothetical protein